MRKLCYLLALGLFLFAASSQRAKAYEIAIPSECYNVQYMDCENYGGSFSAYNECNPSGAGWRWAICNGNGNFQDWAQPCCNLSGGCSNGCYTTLAYCQSGSCV